MPESPKYDLGSDEAKADRARAFALIAAWLNAEERAAATGTDALVDELVNELLRDEPPRIGGVVAALASIGALLARMVGNAETSEPLDVLHLLQQALDDRK